MTTDRTQGNYLFLLAGITVLLTTFPVVLEWWGEAGVLAIHIVYSATLLIGVWSLVGERIFFLCGIFLTIASILVTIAELFFVHPLLWFTGIFIHFLFYTLTLTIAIRHVMGGGHIDFNRIVGAICIYLLIGLIWASIYSVIHTVFPEAFTGLDPDRPERQKAELIYFSFITLTTLGFGDISPVNPIARTLTYLEAVVGQFYLAVMVAGLVGISVTEGRVDPHGMNSSHKSASARDSSNTRS